MRIGTICGLVAVAGIAAYLGYKAAIENHKNEEEEAKSVVADKIVATEDLPLETIQAENITDAATDFAETKSETFEDITDRHLEGSKVVVDSISAIFENDKRIAERKTQSDVVEMPSENNSALDDIMKKLD